MPRFKLYLYIKDLIKIILLPINSIYRNRDLVNRFEGVIRDEFNIKYTYLTNQARVAIYIAIKSVIKEKKEVILSPYTIADVINMVILAGGEPVFVDISKETCNIDADLIEEKVNENTAAILVTHLHGLSCDIENIVEFAKKNNIYVIEDCAQSFGAKVNTQHTGTFGDIGAYSFGLYKNLNSIYGGMLVTNNERVSRFVESEIKSYSGLNFFWFYKKFLKGVVTKISTSRALFSYLVFPIVKYSYFKEIAYINRFVETELDTSRKEQMPLEYLSKPRAFQAEILLSKFNDVMVDNEIRIENARKYFDKLKHIDKLILPPEKYDGSHIFTYFPILCEDREELLDWLMKHNCDLGPQHYKNTAELNSFEEFNNFNCHNTNYVIKNILLLPTYPSYKEENIIRNCEVIKDFFDNGK